MDHLQRLRTFVAVAETGGFARAARAREMSPPAVTRAIGSLERHLGVRLFERSTRSLKLSEAGQGFLADCQRVLAELDTAEAAIRGAQQSPQGTLGVTAPLLFGRRHLAPIVFEFLDRHPQVQVRAYFSSRLVHLIDEGFDVALRVATLPDSGLTAVPVGTLRAVIVASPSYLRRHGTPRSAADLARHQAIGFAAEGQPRVSWAFGRGAAAPRERLLVNDNQMHVDAALAGQGLARVLAYQVADEVEDGRLRLVLPELEPPPVPVHLVYPAGRAAAAKVRAFVGFAAERLRALPVLQGRGLEPPHRGRARPGGSSPDRPAAR